MSKAAWQNVKNVSIDMVSCGWVHFKCSGIKKKGDYNDNVVCFKFSRSRVLIANDLPVAHDYSKIDDAYTHPEEDTVLW